MRSAAPAPVPRLSPQLNATAGGAGGTGEHGLDILDANTSSTPGDQRGITSYEKSFFTITDPKREYRLCDRIEVIIEARDDQDRRKLRGGDYFRVKIYNGALKAGASADGIDVQYIGEGRYRAQFTARWSGEVFVRVILVHSAEAVDILKRARETLPTRYGYAGRFVQTSGSTRATKDVQCNVVPPEAEAVCNLTNSRVHGPWFCAKPAGFECSSFAWTSASSSYSNQILGPLVGEVTDKKLFEGNFQKVKEAPLYCCVREYSLKCVLGRQLKVDEDRSRVEVAMFEKDTENSSWYRQSIWMVLPVTPDVSAHVIKPWKGSPSFLGTQRDGLQQNLLRPFLCVQRKSPIGARGPDKVTVIQQYGNDSTARGCPNKSLPPCTVGSHINSSVAAGYYLDLKWFSNHCSLRTWKAPDAYKCLANKTLYFHGDSTARQYYEFLVKTLPELKPNPPTKQSNWKVGPSLAESKLLNCSIHYRHHGYPIRNNWTNATEVKYIADALDEMVATENTVFFFTIWAHMTTVTLESYEERVRLIRKAVERLHARSPRTLVVIKSANTREQNSLGSCLTTSDWYARSLDLKLREIFADYKHVAFIDQWSMTVAFSDKDNVHPVEAVIRGGVVTLLSYMCPRT
ncbi:NXPE family member 3-like [Diadema setosum]|uniref:NXPE family member 3-like n=1 Tax=Diadema setosum TaxID=31175 RepID=UPI003B3B0203